MNNVAVFRRIVEINIVGTILPHVRHCLVPGRWCHHQYRLGVEPIGEPVCRLCCVQAGDDRVDQNLGKGAGAARIA